MSLAPLRTLRDLLCGSSPENTAVTILDKGKPVFRLSRLELSTLIQKLGWQLRVEGIRPGDVVSIFMANTAEYIAVFLATVSIRAIAAPMNPGLKNSEVSFYMSDVKSKVLIVSNAGNDEAEMAAKKLGVPVLRVYKQFNAGSSIQFQLTAQRNETLPPPSGATWTHEDPIPTDIALYLHTSGTTSRPKLVPLTHHNLCTSIGNIRNTYELSQKDVCYLVMPLFHVHGLVGALFSTLSSGGTVALPLGGKFSAQVFWTDLVACGATWYTAVPTIHQILLRRESEDRENIRRARLRFIRSCSSPLAPAVLEQIEQTFGAPVLEAYAMTEASHQMTSNPLPKNGKRKPGTVGRPTNVQLTVLDENNKVSEPRKVGQVCIRGENVTTGYFNRPQANIEDFAAGWFHTGDQGFLDSEGYLTLTGRLKELVNRGGEKISPIEIDSCLLGHPKIAEAVSFAGPSVKYGEEVRVAVVPKSDVMLTSNDVIAFCEQKLSREKVPAKVFVTDSVPKTATGKIQRRFVAAKFNGVETVWKGKL